MSGQRHQTAKQIHAGLKHPVIDADGHWIEFGPLVREEMRRIGGDRAVEGYTLFPSMMEKNLLLPQAERQEKRVTQGPWWTQPSKNTRDRATVMMPKMLHQRMEELGFDFTVLYPSAGNSVWRIPNDELRRLTCSAFNTFSAEHFAPYADRMTPAAIIPMHSPEEAIAELEHAVKQLGMKVVCLGSMIPRSLVKPQAGKTGADTWLDLSSSNRETTWLDVLGIDSVYDYDPVWQKCIELGVSPTFHSGSRGVGVRSSPSNFVYNHIGHFAAASEAVCKAIFIGGVTRRFPSLKFGFLEGGVGWAAQLLSDLVGHWSKRNLKALEETNPAHIDQALLIELAKTFEPEIVAALSQPDAAYDTVYTPKGTVLTGRDGPSDDLAACRINQKSDIRDLFVDNFYFGCEADDPMNILAFNGKFNPFKARLKALFGSDIGHFDVPDMADVLPEAFEPVEDGLITDDDFRDFMFNNPIEFYCRSNRDFFKGTAVASQVDDYFAQAAKKSA